MLQRNVYKQQGCELKPTALPLLMGTPLEWALYWSHSPP